MLKALQKVKLVCRNIKFTSSEIEEIQEKADLYADGNFSAWLRYAGINHKPKKSELSQEKHLSKKINHDYRPTAGEN